MRAFANRASRLRSSSLTAVPPPLHSSDYSNAYATTAASILFRSPLPAPSGLPIYILNAAAFPDAFEVDYDALLPYVLARLPGEEELIAGEDYEIIFFAGGQPESATSEKKQGPGMGWYLQAYHVLSRAVRKRLQRLYVVHERSWVRVLIEVFGTIVSPKFRKKIMHLSTLTSLALHIPIEKLFIPPSVYLHDRRLIPDIHSPYVSGRRAFCANEPLPRNLHGQRRLPRVLRETTSFICKGDNIKTEGIFRIPPHSILLGVLKEAYDRSQQFILWKEGNIFYTQPDMPYDIMAEVHQADAYGVHLAAGLIKLWYRELKRPIFDESCYDAVRHQFGQSDRDIELADLAEMLSPTSTTSFLTSTARLILILHLLPMLALVAKNQSDNKMSAENLSICFSPALVCGSDQLADAKMTSIVRRLLQSAIEYWPEGLRDACQTAPDSFIAALRPPPAAQDYEDPLQESGELVSPTQAEYAHRILLQDDEEEKPPLPSRPASAPKTQYPKRSDSLASSVKRKPAPLSSTPPPYPLVHGKSRSTASDSLVSHISPVDSFTSGMKSALPSPQTPVVPSNCNLAPLPPPHTDLMKDLKNSLATDIRKRKPVSYNISPISPAYPAATDLAPMTQTRSVSAVVSPVFKNDDDGFARPTWPASARQTSAFVARNPSIGSATTSTTTTTTNNLSAPSYAPRPRTPSPGLLQRMASIESMHAVKSVELAPPTAEKLGLRKASVDDLKKHFEERTNLTRTLSAASSRRVSNTPSS